MYENDNRGQVPGQNDAVVSLVLGILSVVLWFFGYSSILSVVLGVVGLVYASKSKQRGFDGGIRTAGFVLSLIGVIGGADGRRLCVHRLHRLRRRHWRARRQHLLLTRSDTPDSV